MLELLSNLSFPSPLVAPSPSYLKMIKKRGKVTSPGKALVTYPHWVKLRIFLAMQDPSSGLTEKKLESLYLRRGAGKLEQWRLAPIPDIDVDKLSEEEMEELVMTLARGHKVKSLMDRETGKEELHVLMHFLSPLAFPAGAVKEAKKTDDTVAISGERTKVNIFLNQFCVLMLFRGTFKTDICKNLGFCHN